MDFEAINQVIGLAQTAVGETGKAADTARSLKNLFDKGSDSSNSDAQELVNTLAGELTAANLMNVQMSDMLRQLSIAANEYDEFLSQKSRYELVTTNTGGIVFELKAEAAAEEPIHFVCPVCMNRDKLVSFVTGDQYTKRCQTDRDHIFSFDPRPSPTRKAVGHF